MNYKPDEATLISYLYGELDSAEQLQVEQYLQKNPEERKRVNEWMSARDIMAHLVDKEVIAPPIIVDSTTASPWWKERYFRMPLGMAASLLLFLVAARLMNLSVSYSPGELRIGFGTVQKAEPVLPSLTEHQVNNMIQSTLSRNNEVLQASWSEDRKGLEQSIRRNLNVNSAKIDRLVETASTASQEQVRNFVGQMQADNLKLMKDYLQLSSVGQKEYIETILVDFSKYLQEQRNQDLQFFQTRMSNIESNTNMFKQETEQILTSLISNTNTGNQRRN